MKKRRITIKFKFMLLALFLVYIGVSVYIQQSNIADLQKEQQALSERYKQAQTQLSRLEHKNEYMGTSKYIENTAREKLGLVYEDELILTAEEP
ncbi:MAG: septum formation initiator family protein [Christensenellales bacterium]